MKGNHLTKLVIVLSFLVLIIAAASSVVARPEFAGECGSSGCHETFDTLTLSTDSSVDAETGVPFILEIEAGNGAEYIAIKDGWADNGNFIVSETLVQDNSADDINAAEGEISIEVTVTPLTNGTFTFRIWTAAGGDLSESFDVTVTVTGETGTTPPPPVDLMGIWRTMMATVPLATGVILLILGYIALRRN